ncbi:serine/threonine protein kinase [Streptomyces sp. 150FB]|uniref:serine/threonine-protein kinase n=1 Tax=Streptomyces sp. 150FB TaxID=1576605 RepID=UPI0005890B32|nr:serine/threonine-protein kinase [Streptomyces sp. 150FB]KIF75524.1 serine/threonine protein kinase [Streptomyces sp. 150FB]
MGEVFAGRYELIDPIGRGGVGAVWRAWDHRRRRYVAAKVLQQSDAHTLLRFVREQALRIDHPHVLAPASWAADDDKVLFTMDLVSGGSLAHVIGDYGPLPPHFVCVLLDQLLSGLAAVHAEGVIHRDIKPANILMEATGTARPHLRLSDFGISMRKGEPRLTETNYVVGTPGYFAPEQMMGAEPDFTADLFAVGLVGLFLLEGKKPDARALVEYFAEHGTPGAPRGIPEPLWQVLAGLLQPDPEARFRTATGARKALASAVELLPEPGIGDEPVEVFDQIGPLPAPFGPAGPPSPSGPAGPHSTSGSSGSFGPLPDLRTGPQPDPRSGQQPVQQPDQQPGPAPSAAAPSMSDTGSFHLPPPPAQTSWQQPQHQPQQQQGTPYLPPPAQPPTPPASVPVHHASPHPSVPPAPAGPPHSATEPAYPVHPSHHAQAPTPSYVAQVPQVPVAHAHPPAAPHKRPGPPPKVAVPVLLLALICFAVGIWALTRIPG